MNKDWSEKNKEIQMLLSKEATFGEAIKKLIEFREELFQQITRIVEGYPKTAFYQMPFAGAKGYHSKTLAYSIWHIFRIEDIVAHEMIAEDEQILFREKFLKKTGSPIITTGNELEGEEITEFSKKLKVQELYLYAKAVKDSTNQLLLQLQYKDLKRKFSEDTKQKLIESKCVSENENAFWLIDYWCGKNVKGLIQMPFSRHWIMHIEAMLRIKNQLCKIAGL
ncbi:MAG: phage head-tail adapter protein [Lachnospiraceae bacterium]|nr:phage head-tail adapter protein [Lachnospiraceae bacterium]